MEILFFRSLLTNLFKNVLSFEFPVSPGSYLRTYIRGGKGSIRKLKGG